MIVKIPQNRRDGKSSFKDLAKYMTEGIEQSGIPPETTSWDTLTQYITAQSVLNAMGDAIEKTIGVEIGNLASLATAPAEMYAVANKAIHVKNPVYHYILSWPENERPATNDIFSAARDTLKALGMHEHQYIVAIHDNTDNLHAHIEVNRIHPVTFKPQYLNWDHATLHEAARHAELKYGWQHDNGIYQVIEVEGKKHVVRSTEHIDQDLIPTRPGAARSEVWTGEESLETWCKGIPAHELKKVVLDNETKSWHDIHIVLARHGLELKDSGGGGFKVIDISESTEQKLEENVAVRASAVFRFLKRKELESKLGSFVPADKSLMKAKPERTYKRDPHKRLESRLSRKELRDTLHKRYKQEVSELKAIIKVAKASQLPQLKKEYEMRQELQNSYKEKRQAIKVDRALTPVQKQQMYMLAKLAMQKAQAQLSETIANQRRERDQLIPPVKSWRLWVEEQAILGDEAAISALRGMIYQDGRDLNKKVARDMAREDENAIHPVKSSDTYPQTRKLKDLIWQVAKNGAVNYQFSDGTAAFKDEGDRLTFGRKSVSDESLALSLQYGADRWKDGIRISGGDHVFKERLVRQAVIMGIKINNIELRQLENQIKNEVNAITQHRKMVNVVVPPSSNVLQHVSTLDTDVEALIHEIRKNAKITYVKGDHAKALSGRIVAQNARYLVQEGNRSDFFVHERKAFSHTPEHGDYVEIIYKNGSARQRSVTPSKQRKGR